MKQKVKIAVTGAAGQIGYALIFRLASGQVFGPDVQVDLNLLEVTPALPALKGVVMELEDCAFPLLGNVITTDDANTAMRDINLAILIGSMPRKAGMERADLLQANGSIFTVQGKAINDHAASDVKVFVVGNPCNTNCLIAMKNAPDVPNDRFFAMTMLDQNRARSQLAIKAGVPLTAVKELAIWGNHSSTQYPDFYHAKINGKPTIDVIDETWLQQSFLPMIQQRGATVIAARGASSAASAANAALGTVMALIQTTVADDYYSVASCSKGEYGVQEGLIFSFPTRTSQKGEIEIVMGIEHNEFSKQKLQATMEELKHEYDAVKNLKLID